MFERFTDRARRSLVLAESEANGLQHQFIGTEHVLLGLLAEGTGVAAVTLSELGLSLDRAREVVAQTIGASSGQSKVSKPPFTPRAKKVLELSLREALKLRHTYIGTEHLLLGLVKEGEGVAAQVLVHENLPLAAVQQAVLARLQAGPDAPASSPSTVIGLRTAANITPAAIRLARERPGDSGLLSSHHYLLALFEDDQSMAAKALEELGITRQQVEAVLDRLDVQDSSDAPPKPRAAAAPIEFDLGQGITLRINDREVYERLFRSGDFKQLTSRLHDLKSDVVGATDDPDVGLGEDQAP